MTFLVDQWQSCVCSKRTGVTPCTLLMVLYLDRMCQRGLHAVLWSHIGTIMHRLAAEPCSTAGLLFSSRCPSGTILLTPYTMVWDWRFQEHGQCFFIGLSCSIPTIIFYSFSISLLSLYIGWYCGAGVFGLIGCIPLSLSLALPSFFNNNKQLIYSYASLHSHSLEPGT